MHHIAEIDTTSVCSWSPKRLQAIMVATGSASGALDESFSSDSFLEIFLMETTYTELKKNAIKRLSSIEVSSRYLFFDFN